MCSRAPLRANHSKQAMHAESVPQCRIFAAFRQGRVGGIAPPCRAEPHSGRIFPEPLPGLQARLHTVDVRLLRGVAQGWSREGSRFSRCSPALPAPSRCPAPRVAAQCGKAAWYDLGGQTASGEPSDGSALAAAHRTLPFGTKVRVDNLSNGRVGRRPHQRPRSLRRRPGDRRDPRRRREARHDQSGIAKVRVSVVDGKASLDNSCEDPAPRVITADAVAKDAAKARPARRRPAETQTAAIAAPDRGRSDTGRGRHGRRTPSPNQSKPVAPGLRARCSSPRVRYDEGDGGPAPRARRTRAAAAGGLLRRRAAGRRSRRREDRRRRSVDIPLPRPRPPIFDDARPPSTGRWRSASSTPSRRTNSGMELERAARLRGDRAARRRHHRMRRRESDFAQLSPDFLASTGTGIFCRPNVVDPSPRLGIALLRRQR